MAFSFLIWVGSGRQAKETQIYPHPGASGANGFAAFRGNDEIEWISASPGSALGL
jgi:hypothetical protein